ncbi:hypothetical protein K8I31_11610, partial [bacterium]|nr:hypothetical protein [bacterium]
ANVEFEWENLIGSAEYRYYYYFDYDQDTSFLHHGWLGYKLTDQDQIHLGVHQVPFGILPYASHNWFFQLPYYVGLEDDYDLGVKYIHQDDNWNLQLAYYAEDEGNYIGDSEDSARYSYDLVAEGASQNIEENQFNIRYAYTWEHSEGHSTELGVSLQLGQVHNRAANDDGNQYAAGLHVNEYWNQWNLMAEIIRYEYSLRNPPGVGNDFVLMGAYDFPYEVASRANLYTIGLSYTIPVEHEYIDSVTLYDDFSILDKDQSRFADSFQNVVGASVSAGNFFIYFDIASGKNQPWLGPIWTDALSSGGDDEWYTRFNINIGFYI